jgi:hypothetical protein
MAEALGEFDEILPHGRVACGLTDPAVLGVGAAVVAQQPQRCHGVDADHCQLEHVGCIWSKHDIGDRRDQMRRPRAVAITRQQHDTSSQQRVIDLWSNRRDPAHPLRADVGMRWRGEEVLTRDVEEVRRVDGRGLHLHHDLPRAGSQRVELHQ